MSSKSLLLQENLIYSACTHTKYKENPEKFTMDGHLALPLSRFKSDFFKEIFYMLPQFCSLNRSYFKAQTHQEDCGASLLILKKIYWIY